MNDRPSDTRSHRRHRRHRRPSAHALPLGLALLLLVDLVPQVAHASCALIPVALQELRSTKGTVDRALARPLLDEVTVRVDLACDANATGFDPVASNNNLTLRFEPPGGPPTDVAVSVSSVDNCGSGPTARCDTLRFFVPDTDDLVAPSADGKGLTGPARILVDDQADIGPLYLPTLSCDDQQSDGVFEHFTVLPTATPFDPGTTEVLGTIDGAGNLLIHFDFSSVLPADPGSPLFILLEGNADIVAFTGTPGQFVRLPDKRFLRAFSTAGRPLPPFLETNSVGDNILGSVDFAASVIRVARVDPDNPTGPALFDFSDRLKGGKGPIEITLATPLNSLAVAPLKSLNATGELIAFAQDEAIEATDRNSDGDQGDQMAYIVQRGEAAGTDTGTAVVEVSTAELGDIVIEAENDLIAFLESEAHAGIDRTNDDDLFDSILRVYTADGTQLAPSLHVTADPAPRVSGRPLVVSNDFVFFRTHEGDGLQRLTERVSLGPGAVQTDGSSFNPELSGNGRYVVYDSSATNLLGPGNDTNGGRDVFVFDRNSATTVRVSVSSGGVEGNLGGLIPDITPDGRFVVFQSSSTNLGSAPYSTPDVYVHDRDTDTDGIFDEVGAIATIKLTADSEVGRTFKNPSISDDGRHLTFIQDDDFSDGEDNIIAYDRDTDADGIFDEVGFTSSVEIDAGASGSSNNPVISGNGRFIAFDSDANDIVAGDTNGQQDVFLHDRDLDEDGVFDEPGQTSTVRISVSETGVQATSDSSNPAIDGTGRFVAFMSEASNLIPGDTNATVDFFVRDMQTGTLEFVQLNSNGQQGTGIFEGTEESHISADGRFVTMESDKDLLVPDDTNGSFDVFRYDRTTNEMERSSVSSTGTEVAFASGGPISADGRWVAIRANDSALVAGDTNGFPDIFVRGHDGSGSSLNTSDSDLDDTVLQVFARSSASLRSGARVVASEVAVAAGRAAVLSSEREEGNTNLNSGGGDSDTNDTVARLYDANTNVLTNLGVAASRIAISANIVCLTVPEAQENGADRNSDGDSSDEVLAVWDIAGATLTNVGVASGAVKAVGTKCIFVTPEADQGASGTDLNGDSDVLDDVIRVYDHSDPAPLPANRITEIGNATADFSLVGEIVAYRTCEADQGNTILNGDGDTADCVMQIYNHVTDTNTNTLRAARPCDFSGCDPFFEPYRIEGEVVSFVTFEADQSGSQLAPGCFSTGVLGECDHTSDGDNLDIVMHVFHIPSLRAQVYEISDVDPDPVPPFPMEGMLAVQVPENDLGADINGDGMIDGTLVTVVAGDSDHDGVFDDSLSNDDLCVEVPDLAQGDADTDTLGDTCDPNDASPLPGTLPCDANLDAAVTQADIEIILLDLGMDARSLDGRDADLDGIITQGDADFCAANCDIGQICNSMLCGNGTIDAVVGEECDDGNNIDGDTCSKSCQSESILDFEGSNNGAGTLFVTVDGVMLSVPLGTVSEDLAAQELADAINENATLQGMGVSAQTDGARVISNGAMVYLSGDPNLLVRPPKCDDLVDNEGDGDTDLADNGCLHGADDLESLLVPGDLLVGDLASGQIVRIDRSSGAQEVVFDSLELDDPTGLAFEPDGSLLALDSSAFFRRLLRFRHETGVRIKVTSAGAYNVPRGLVFEDATHVVVADEANALRRTDLTGGFPQTETIAFMAGPWGVAKEASGDFIVTQPSANQVSRVTPLGSVTTLSSGISQPRGVVVTPDGTIYAVEAGLERIVEIHPLTGVRTPLITIPGSNLRGLALEGAGTLVAADYGNGNVVRIHPAGPSYTVLSSGGLLSQPYFVAVVTNVPVSVPVLPLSAWLGLALCLVAIGGWQIRSMQRRASGR